MLDDRLGCTLMTDVPFTIVRCRPLRRLALPIYRSCKSSRIADLRASLSRPRRGSRSNHVRNVAVPCVFETHLSGSRTAFIRGKGFEKAREVNPRKYVGARVDNSNQHTRFRCVHAIRGHSVSRALVCYLKPHRRSSSLRQSDGRRRRRVSKLTYSSLG